MHFQIDYLRTFAALAEAKNFTKTGVQVNLSQSAVSMQIKRLETEVGKKLFHRIGKTVKLTPEGSILLAYALRIIREHDEAVAALSKPNLEGHIRFGSPEHYTAGVLPNLLARFSKSYPDITVEMHCENSDVIKEWVDKGKLDLGICTQISQGGRIIAHDPVVWAVSPEFVRQKHKPLPLAVFEADCIFRTWALEALEKSGINHRIVYVSRSISGLLDAVTSGFAIAPVIKSNVPKTLRIAQIEEGLPVLPVSNIALHRPKKPSSDIIDCFADHVIKSFRKKTGI